MSNDDATSRAPMAAENLPIVRDIRVPWAALDERLHSPQRGGRAANLLVGFDEQGKLGAPPRVLECIDHTVVVTPSQARLSLLHRGSPRPVLRGPLPRLGHLRRLGLRQASGTL
jgi:hypothetical protein